MSTHNQAVIFLPIIFHPITSHRWPKRGGRSSQFGSGLPGFLAGCFHVKFWDTWIIFQNWMCQPVENYIKNDTKPSLLLSVALNIQEVWTWATSLLMDVKNQVKLHALVVKTGKPCTLKNKSSRRFISSTCHLTCFPSKAFDIDHCFWAMPPKPPTPDEDTLARLWESDFSIRDRLRIYEGPDGKPIGGKLLSWPDPKNKCCSMPAIAMNIRVLTLLAEWWCPTQKVPKAPSIDILKREAVNVKKHACNIM